MKCEICDVTSPLSRQNPKGEPGVWRCRTHNEKDMDPVVEGVVEAVGGAAQCVGHFRAVEIEEDGSTKVAVRYVGVHLLDWRPEWGQPVVAFVEVDND